MRLTDILKPESVVVPLQAADKQDAVYQLVDLLAQNAGIADVQQLRDAVWQREQTRTTGIGNGVAIPHGKCACVATLAMAIAKPEHPIEYNAIDNRPVDLIILLASPVDQTGPHIQALATISKMLCANDTRNAIKQAATAEQLYNAIAAAQPATTQ